MLPESLEEEEIHVVDCTMPSYVELVPEDYDIDLSVLALPVEVSTMSLAARREREPEIVV